MTKQLIGAVFALSLVLAACGDDSGEGSRDEIVSFLEEQGETPESAQCFADELSDYNLSDFQAVADSEDGTDLDSKFVEDITAAGEKCAADTGE